jgi:hypothetical protein
MIGGCHHRREPEEVVAVHGVEEHRYAGAAQSLAQLGVMISLSVSAHGA